MSDEAVNILNDEEAWARLSTQKIGRLATNVGDVVDLVPVNFVVDDQGIVFRTAPGSKLAGLMVSSSVVFEVDEVGEERGWSVVVHGTARVLERDDEIAAVEKLPLKPQVATVKLNFVRITPSSITGRAFVFGPEPETETYEG